MNNHTMEQLASKGSLKNYDENIEPYYIKEITSWAIKRKLFKPEDVDNLGAAAAHLDVEEIHAKTSLGQYIVDFLNKATIHGLIHLVAPHRHSVERVLTAFFLGIAFACLIVSSMYSWEQYQTNPSSMVVDLDFKHFNVTMPAVTVCLFNKIVKDKFSKVFKKFDVNDTKEARNFFTFISNTKYSTLNQTPMYNDTSPNKWLEILNDLYVEPEGRMGCLGTTDALCKLTNKLMTNVVTEKGICTTALSTYSNYSSVDYWLANNWTVFPYIQYLAAWKYNTTTDRIRISNISEAYEITLHYPNDVPTYSDVWDEYKKMEVADIKITIYEVGSSHELRKLSRRQRPCYFPEDGDLKMWPVYTRNMCLLECRYNFFKIKCGCYPHFARPMPGIPICNVTQLHCIGDHSDLALSLSEEGPYSCRCPESCNTAKYNRLVLHITVFKGDKMNGVDSLTTSYTSLNIDPQFPFHKFRHEVFFGFNEFLVSVGGAAGLFLGASIISIIEIIYYPTLRLFWWKKTIVNTEQSK